MKDNSLLYECNVMSSRVLISYFQKRNSHWCDDQIVFFTSCIYRNSIDRILFFLIFSSIKSDSKSSQSQTSRKQNHAASVFTSHLEPQLKQAGALCEQVYHGLFNSFDYRTIESTTYLIFIQFPDVVRELTDFRKFSLQPNKHDVATDHYMQVRVNWTS